MTDAGSALMGIGEADGENRAAEAARAAVSSPLLEASVEGATGILLNITGGPDLGLFEVNEAAEVVTGAADMNANVIFGAVIDENMEGKVRVTVIATGFDRSLRRDRREVEDRKRRRADRGHRPEYPSRPLREAPAALQAHVASPPQILANRVRRKAPSGGDPGG